MSVTLRVVREDFSTAARKAETAEAAAKSALALAARRDSEQLVPYLTGDLRRTAETESRPEQGLLVYGNAAVPYARPQYYGCPRKTWPGTTMKWFEEAKSVFMESWAKEAQESAREAVGR